MDYCLCNNDQIVSLTNRLMRVLQVKHEALEGVIN